MVIIGSGFGGLAATHGLARAPVDVTVIDRTNHHLFQPLLYQVATGGLSGPAIAAPIRQILRRQRNVTVLLGEVVRIDPDRRKVVLDDGVHDRDYATLATIGRNAAVAVVGRIRPSGFVAWLFWVFLHLFFLIGFRNRIVVMLDWAWSYFTFERYARIAMPEPSAAVQKRSS